MVTKIGVFCLVRTVWWKYKGSSFFESDQSFLLGDLAQGRMECCVGIPSLLKERHKLKSVAMKNILNKMVAKAKSRLAEVVTRLVQEQVASEVKKEVERMYSEIDTSLGKVVVELSRLKEAVESVDIRLDSVVDDVERISQDVEERIDEIDTETLTYGQEREVESLIEEAISEIKNLSEFSSDQIDTINGMILGKVEDIVEDASTAIAKSLSEDFSSDQIDTIEDIVYDKLEQFRNEHEEIKDIVEELKKQLQDVRDTVELRDAFTGYNESEEDASSEESDILDSKIEYLNESIDEIDTRLSNLTRIIARGLMHTANAVESTDQI